MIYLVFNEGYNAAASEILIRHELCSESIRLGRLMCEVLAKETEAQGLLALMLLHDSRRGARRGHDGKILPLEEQDRRRWNREQIAQGITPVESALRRAPAGPYSVQAAIAALHAHADRAENTYWAQIARLYDVLLRLQPSPVVELNRAVAIAMDEGPSEGLRVLPELETRDELPRISLIACCSSGFIPTAGRWSEAADAYRRALSLVTNEAERRFLLKRLAEAESKVL